MTPIPLRYEGEGGFICLSPHWKREADKLFVVGEFYLMSEESDRSSKSHAHYFAVIADAWQNLPDHLYDEYATPEVLRKKMLIKSGYADENTFVASSKAEAMRIAAFMRPADDFAIVTVRENVVRRFTAKSQSVRAMGKAEFQASKDAVLNALDDLLQLHRGTVATEAGKAA